MADQLKLTTELEAAIKTNDLKTVMKVKGISFRSMVELMRTRFSRFDKTLLSKARNPEVYGVVLHPDGYKMLAGYPDRKPEHRKLEEKFTFRMTKDEAIQLRYYASKDGYKSIQDCVRDQLKTYICIGENVLGRMPNDE